MSGYEKQGGWSSEYAQPTQNQGYGGYQQPPPQGGYQQQYGGQPPPAYGQPPHPQGQYGSPSPPQGQYGAPPPQGQYGAPPPPGQYGAPPPQGQYGAPPPQQGQWGAPPQQQYGAPPPQGQYGGAPPQGQYGAPPQGQYGAPPQQPSRHHVTFRFSGNKNTILNSQVHDPYGKTPFTVQSDKKHTIVRASNGAVVGKFDWDHSSPVLEYNGRKLKAKEWIPYHKDSGTRKLTFEGKAYDWTTRQSTNYLEPTDRPGYSYVVWHDETEEVIIDVYQEALVIPGLLEAAILGVVLMQSGHPIGDVGKGGSGTPYLGMAIGASIGSMIAF